MSNQIENNVVQMSFDNRDFEKNITTSSKSIDKLNEQLKFKDAGKGFKDVERYANSVNFSGLEKAINNINSVFTVTGALSKKIIDDIAGYFENKIIGAVSAVKGKISYIMDTDLGIKKYEQYTTAVNTMSANFSDVDARRFSSLVADGMYQMGEEYKYAENYISKIALFTDETSYSLTDMVDTMSKFSAANVPLEESSKAMMGFANMAAVAGQNSTTATAAMYQLAQSFSTGYVKYQDWQQAFGLKNIATKEAKEIFINAALAAGTLDDKDIAQAKKELGENWQNWFYSSEQLNQGWLSTDKVLITGLQKYSKASDEILNNMGEIGERVSVTDMLDWAKAYKNAGGSAQEFAKNLQKHNSQIKDTDKLAATLEKLASEEYELGLKAFEAAQKATNFHEAIDAVRDAVGTKMMYAFKYFIGDLEQAKSLWTSFSNSLWDIFAGPLDSALGGLEAWNAGLLEVDDTTIEIEDNYEKFWESIGRVFTGIGSIINGFIDEIRILGGAFEFTEEGLETTSLIEKNTLGFMQRLTRGVASLADKIENFLKSDIYKNLIYIFKNVIRTIGEVKKVINSVFTATIGTAIKNLGGPIKELTEFLVELSGRIGMFVSKIRLSETFEKATSTISRLIAKLMELGAVIIRTVGDGILKILDKTFSILGKIFTILEPAIDWLIDAIDIYIIPAIDALIDGPYSIGHALEFLGDKFDWAKDKIVGFLESALGIDFNDAKSKIGDFANYVSERASVIGGGVFGILKDYGKQSFDADTAGSFADLFSRLGDANSLAEGAKSTISWTGDALMRPVQLIVDLASFITGKDLTKIGDAISNFITSFTDSLADISPNVLAFIQKVMNIVFDILKIASGFIVDILKYITGMSDTTGYKLVDDVISSLKTLLASVIDIFVYLLTSVAKVAKFITPGVKSIIDFMGLVIMNFVTVVKDMFATFATVKDPKQFMSYIWMLVKYIVGIIILLKVGKAIYGAVTAITYFGNATKALGGSVDKVATSVSHFVDSMAGNTFGGLLRIFAILLFSFGYALSNIIKAGESLSDEKNIKGVIIVFVMMLLLLKVLVSGALKVMKTQSDAYKEIESAIKRKEKAKKKLLKLQKKHGTEGGMMFLSKKDKKALALDPDSMRKEADSMKESLRGVGAFLAGMGVAIVGISLGLSILAKASKNTSTQDLANATTSILLIMLTAGLMTKMMRGKEDYSSIKEGKNSSLIKKGDSYKGVATALISFAMAAVLLTIPIAILAHTSKNVGKENMNKAVAALASVMLVIGAVMFLLKKNRDSSFFKSITTILMINSITAMIIVLSAALAGLAFVLGRVVKPESYGTIIAVSAIMLGFFVAIGAFIIMWNKTTKKVKLFNEIKKTISQLTNLFVVSIALTMMTVAVAEILGVIMLMTLLMRRYTNGDTSNLFSLLATVGMTVLVVVGLFEIVKVLEKISAKMNKKGIGQMMKLASLMIIVSTAITLITASIFAMSYMFKNVDAKSVILALVSVSIITAAMIALLSKISDSGSSSLLSMAKNILGVIVIIPIIAMLALLTSGLAILLQNVEFASMVKAVVLIGLVALVVGGIVVGMSKISKNLSSVKSLVKITGAIFIVVGIIATMAVLVGALAAITALVGAGNMIMAVVTIGLIAALLGGIILGMMALTKVLNNSDGSGNLSTTMLKLSVGIFLVVTALAGLSAIIIILANALEAVSAKSIFKALLVLAGALLAIAGVLVVLALVGKLGAAGLKAVAMALLILVGVILLSLAALYLMGEYGDKIIKWLDDKGPKIRESFHAIGKAIAEMLTGFIEGLNDVLPDLLAALATTIDIIFTWIEDNIHDWAVHLVNILAELLDGIGDGIQDNAEKIGNALWKIVKGLWDILKTFLSKVGDAFWDEMLGDPLEECHQKMEASEIRHQEEMYQIRRQGAEMYQALLDNLETAADQFSWTSANYGTINEATGDLINTADIARAANNMNAAKKAINDVDAAHKEVAKMRYGVDLSMSAAEARANNPYLQDYDENLNYREGVNGINNPRYYNQGKVDGKSYGAGLTDGTMESTGTHSPSTVFEWIGSMLSAGITKGADGEGTGSGLANGLIGGFTDKFKSAKDTFTGAFGNLFGGGDTGSLIGSMMGDEAGSSFTDAFSGSVGASSLDISGMNFDMSGTEFDMNSMGMTNIPTAEDLMTDDSLNYAADLDIGATDSQINQLSGSVEGSNEDVVNAINNLSAKMDEYATAIARIQMVLDSGTLVGEIVAPMDKALGELNNRKAARGI